MIKRAFLFLFFFVTPVLFSGAHVEESANSVQIIEKINAFILDSSYKRSLVVRYLLKKYKETGNERLLKLVFVLIDKNDPLYELLASRVDTQQLNS